MAASGLWPGSRVARTLRVLGLLLLVIGASGYLVPAGPAHWTALIPALLGGLALLASLVPDVRVAAALGAAICAAAVLGGGSALAQLPALLSGEAGAAVASRATTALAAIAALGGIAYALASSRRSA
jgi:hypothetical protein